MARRKNQLFSLAFLDLVTGALGAVIFLFIITPKGGSSAAHSSQVVMYMDTTEMKVFGSLDDSLHTKRVGDTLLTVLVDYKHWPKPAKRKTEEKTVTFVPPPKPQPVSQPEEPKRPTRPAKPTPAKPTRSTEGPSQSPVFKGDAPSVPCKVSFEVSWANKSDNVDFYVCKGDDCVYGGRKRDNGIGTWDSGKSRNRLFGNDLRTSQEAVRQFDKILPGTYRLYARFKESKNNNRSLKLEGLIYTKGPSNVPRGESYTKTLPLSKNRVLLGTVILRQDGTYQFIQK